MNFDAFVTEERLMKITAKQTMSGDLDAAYMMDNLASTYDRMTREKIRHLPVLDDSGIVVGIISDRDFKRAMWPVESAGDNYKTKDPVFKSSAVVSDYMSGPVKSVEYKTELAEVAKMMVEEKISAVLVAQSDELIGIVTHEDLLKVLIMLLRHPDSPKDRVTAWLYNSPIGKVVSTLSEVGL
jgi:acetoin utilization protein AcuB